MEEEYRGNEHTLSTDFTRQDFVILNILRACQAGQDLANRFIRIRQLGIPQNARESFSLLADAQLLPPELVNTLSKMVGFRNIALNEHQELNIDILRAVVDKHLPDLLQFAKLMLVAK